MNISSWTADRLANIAKWNSAAWSHPLHYPSSLAKDPVISLYVLDVQLSGVNGNQQRTWTLGFIAEPKRLDVLPYLIIWHNHSLITFLALNLCHLKEGLCCWFDMVGQEIMLIPACHFLQQTAALGISGQSPWASYSIHLHTVLMQWTPKPSGIKKKTFKCAQLLYSFSSSKKTS